MKGRIIAAVAAVILLTAASACKGRTMENVEPDGQTVDVVIDTVAIDTVM